MREGDFARLHASLPDALLGDVIVSVPTARKQANEQRKELLDELTMLIAHGLLHLLGWDHDTPAKDKRMRAETQRLCEAAGAPNAVDRPSSSKQSTVGNRKGVSSVRKAPAKKRRAR